MTPGDVRKKYSMFSGYQYTTFANALKNAQKTLVKEVKACKDNKEIKAWSNLECNDKVSYAMSQILIESDSFSYDTLTLGEGYSRKTVTFGEDSIHSCRKSLFGGTGSVATGTESLGGTKKLDHLCVFFHT